MYEVFKQLCEEKGLKPSEVAKGTGLYQTLFSEWKKGKSNPNTDKMIKIANFLGVSVEYLMTGKDKTDISDNKYYINEETQEMAQAIFKNKELRLLFSEAMDAQPEDLKATHDILLALKRKERGND